MKFFHVQFINDIELTYELINHEATDLWASLIQKETVEDLCRHNHYHGFYSEEEIKKRIERLYSLSDIINLHVPERVIKREINKESWKNALKIMHVHFPDLKNNVSYKHIWKELSEYNDTIHWLESVLHCWNNENSETKYFRINLDFNKKPNQVFYNIPESCYKFFNPFTNFGYLLLHYTHVGKHAQELFTTKDLTCPSDQFIPQRKFTSSVRMYFTDNFYGTEEKKKNYLNQWSNFYNLRGKEFWGYEISDPKIAFGYLHIGNLISINNNKLPENSTELNEFRKLLGNSKILGWKINGD